MQDRKGFTLIELLIVVVIIGILAAIAIPKFSATREKAYFSAMKSDLRNLQSTQEMYYASGDYVYANDTSLFTDFAESDGVTVDITEGTETGWAATAVHAALDAGSQTCGVFVGQASQANGAPATVPGQVTCEGEN